MIKTTAEQLRAKAEEFLRSAPFHFPRTPRLSEAQDLIRELLATIAAAPSPPSDVEMSYRRELWLNHGHATVLYGDDGEMQCGICAPVWDYKRAPLADVERAAREARLAQNLEALRAAGSPLVAAPPGTAPEGASPAPQQELLVATKRLAVEVSGMLGTIEHEMREAAGNTNVNVLIQRWEEAKAAIAKADAALDAGGQE